MNQNNGEFANEYVLCVAFETLFASYKDKKDLDKHIEASVLHFVDLTKDKKISEKKI